MRTTTLSILFVLLVGSPGHAQGNPVGPPVAGRPTDFSNIIGSYRIEASAEPREVRVEEPITLTVRILGAGNAKFEPRRKLLNVLPDWSADFFVEPVPDEDQVSKDKKVWSFVYRLRPKHVDITAIERITLSYFNPKTNVYARSYASPVDIVVKPKRDDPAIVDATINAPDSFWRVDNSRRPLQQHSLSMTPPTPAMLAAIVAPPLTCLVAFALWTLVRPDEARARKHQQRRAAQRAIDGLKSNRAFPWVVLREYLEERFDFEIDDPTPEDIAAFLKQRGFTKENCELGRSFMNRCDAIRFAHGAADVSPLKDETIRLIEALEADRCVR
jgi:hypothetical protein